MADPKMEKREGEPNVEEVLASLAEKRKAEVESQRERPDDWLEQRVDKLPERARNDVRSHVETLEKDGIKDPERLAAHAEREVQRFETTYEEQRFTVGENQERMLKDAYAKEQFLSQMQDVLAGEVKPDDLKKVARLSFDANGLKAVNDLSASHEKGTEYLKRIAEVFHATESPERKRLEELGVTEVIPTTGGGDEYSVLIRSEKPLEPEVLDEAVRLYEDAIQQLDVADLVDFKDFDTRLRYIGVSRKDFDYMKSREEKLERATKHGGYDPETQNKLEEELILVRRRLKEMHERMNEIPEDFEMRASASGGAATALDALYTAMRHPAKPLEDGDTYQQSLQKIMGGLWDASDVSAAENKTVFKEALRKEGAEQAEKFYSKVLARTTEARMMEDRLNALQDENTLMKKKEEELEKLDELLEAEALSFKEYKRLKGEIKERYAPAS